MVKKLWKLLHWEKLRIFLPAKHMHDGNYEQNRTTYTHRRIGEKFTLNKFQSLQSRSFRIDFSRHTSSLGRELWKKLEKNFFFFCFPLLSKTFTFSFSHDISAPAERMRCRVRYFYPPKKGFSCVWIIYNLLSGPSSESGSWIFIANSRHSSDLSSSPSLTHIFLPLAEAFMIRNTEWVNAYFTSTRRAASSCVIGPDIAVVRYKKGLNICEACSRARVSVWISDWKRRQFRRRKSAWERTFFMHNMMSKKNCHFLTDWKKLTELDWMVKGEMLL